MKVDCSIVVLSYNGFHQTTGPCLQTLFEDSELKNEEIIVIDNCSQDESPQRLQESADG